MTVITADFPDNCRVVALAALLDDGTRHVLHVQSYDQGRGVSHVAALARMRELMEQWSLTDVAEEPKA